MDYRDLDADKWCGRPRARSIDLTREGQDLRTTRGFRPSHETWFDQYLDAWF